MASLNLPKTEYVVFGSAPMVFVQLRKSNDIDLFVTQSLFSKLYETGWKAKTRDDGTTSLSVPGVEAFVKWSAGNYSADFYAIRKRATEHKDIPIASLLDVKEWKQALGRQKDFKDLQLIEDFIKS